MKKKTNKLFGLFIFAAMLTLLLTQAAFAESADITTADDFYKAIQDESITDMNITGNITVDAQIEKAVNIDVMSGAELKLGYDEGENGVSRFCNANITVEDGGEVVFSHTVLSDDVAVRYLIMNGDFILKSGAEAKINKWTPAYGGVVFQGKFENNGTFDCGNGGENGQLFAYVKFDTPLGNVTNGYIVYNLCRTMPSEETIANKAIRITAINGNVKVGETLTAEIDGFGDSSKFPMNSIGWEGNNYTDSGNYHTTYTIVPKDAGKKIGAKFNGIGLISGPTSSRPYDYLVVKDNVVTVIHNGTDKIETETDYVPYSDRVYLGGENSNDMNAGNSSDKAVASIRAALNLVSDKGTIVVCGNVQLDYDGNYVYIRKDVVFTNSDGENTYAASFTGGTGNYYSMFYLFKENGTVKFSGIKFNDAIFTAAGYEGCKFIMDNVSTDGNGFFGVFIINNGFYEYESFTMDIRSTGNADLYVLNEHTSFMPIITLNNSNITSYGDGSIGDVTLLNNSKLKTYQPMNSLTADNTNNAIELMADDEGNIIPISIEGDITIAGSKPIKVVYENAFTEGQTLFNSSKQNDSLTADKFSVSQKGLVLKKLSDSNSIVTAKDETESTSYMMENEGTETGANDTTATYFKITAPIKGTITGVNVTGNGETKPFNWENPVEVSGGVEVTLGLIVDGLLDENALAELIVK